MRRAGKAPKHRKPPAKTKKLQARTLNTEKAFKALVAVGQVAAFLYAVHSCS